MKISDSPITLLAAILCGLFAMTETNRGAVQTYSFTAPITGSSEIDLSFGVSSTGGYTTTFGTLSETLYYDPIAETLRQVGSVSVNPSSSSISISPSMFNPGVSGTANPTIGDGSGTFSFDTGTQSLSSESAASDWLLAIPIGGNCTVDNNGQLTTGPLDYFENISLSTDIESASPSSLTLSEANVTGESPASIVATIGGVDLTDGTDDGTYYYSWSVGQITANAVPEPEPTTLFAGALPLFYLVKNALRVRRRNKTA